MLGLASLGLRLNVVSGFYRNLTRKRGPEAFASLTIRVTMDNQESELIFQLCPYQS